MIIGIDADGVLTDMAGFNREYGERFWKCKPTNPTAYKTGDMFGVGHGQEILFGIRYFNEYCRKLAPRKGAAAVNRRLNADGHGLYILSARKYATMNNPLGWLSKSMFTGWLQKNRLHFKRIFFCTEKNTPVEKFRFCKRISADIMIDDNPEVALYLAENGIKVFLFDAPYNIGIRHKNITRVHSWAEICRIISE